MDGPEDVGAFAGWLNGVREEHGLPPVIFDQELTDAAALNNAIQERCGLGHYGMGPARRQNAGTGTLPQVCAAWLASAPHRAALLDPTIERAGIAGDGRYWTFNAS